MAPENTEKVQGLVEVVVDPTAGDRRIPATTTDKEAVKLPTSTAEEDRKALGHRQINMTWERTQQIISIWMVLVTTLVCAYLVIYGSMDLKMAAFLLLSTFCTSVVTTYFVRTNHTKTSDTQDHR